ncbi:MAG: hypothetical protein Q9222_005866 [Ikaeria aurantiellina]
MWLRDSANQILSYLPILQPSQENHTIAALFRGVINLQSRYIKISPYCHAFQPPQESHLRLGVNLAYHRNKVKPAYDRKYTFDCKWELDSLASFLQLSSEYYNSTGDLGPFVKYRWVETIGVILDAVEAMRTPTYTLDGHIAPSGYTMTGYTDRATETTSNDGLGNPVKYTGMIRSTFRPSDDATIHQFLIPSNMMFARYLEATSTIMSKTNAVQAHNLTIRMRTMASEIRTGITKYGIVHHSLFGPIFAYEVDGYGSHNLMDDANLPSLLSAAAMGYVSPHDEVHLNTRLFALSEANPYWMHGDTLDAIGGPHLGPTKGWPLASIVRIMTSTDNSGEEAREEIRTILNTTDGLGGGSGFGAGIAKTFAEQGAKVLVADINEAGGTRTVESSPDRMKFHLADVAKQEDWKSLVSATETAFGRIDCLVNNAGTTYRNKCAELNSGFQSRKPTLEVTEADFDKCFTVNVKSVFFGIQAVVPRLQEQKTGGSIINIASIGATRPRPGLVWYNSSKGAVLNQLPMALLPPNSLLHTPKFSLLTTPILGNQIPRRGIRSSTSNPRQRHPPPPIRRDSTFRVLRRNARYPRQPLQISEQCAPGTAV